MNYKYLNNYNFEDFASGRVLYHKNGMPNFPVRLAGEIFLRCLHYTGKNEITLYDPCCGSSYMLTVLGLLNIQAIKNIIASDISDDAISLSKSNLSLLSESGLNSRKELILKMIAEFNKPSHLEALESVNKFIDVVKSCNGEKNIEIFKADILAPNGLADKNFKADIVITDVPYGNLVTWSDKNADAANVLLENLLPVLTEKSVVAVITDKSQKVSHERYHRMEKIKAGKRLITILTVKIQE